jgi:hypothetical protein
MELLQAKFAAMAPFVGMMSFDFVILSLWIRAERLEGEDRLNLKKLYFLAIFCLRAGVAVTPIEL